MASRRQVREAAVQFLYCADLEGGAEPTDLRGPFWDFITESDRRSLQVATFRTVIHLAQGREARLLEFQTRAKPAAAHLSAWPEAESLKLDLQHIAVQEDAWSAAYDKLERLPLDDTDKSFVADQFSRGLEVLFGLDRDLAASRQRFLEGLEDHPKLRGQLESVAASIRRLQRVSDRMRMVEHPEQFPEQGDLGKLRDSKASIETLRQHADQLVDAVLAHKETIDQALAAVVENYSPERIDPVDRAVLRLATYELAHTATPTKVILNEAIELARRFGTTDSHRFVNGLLDPLARQTREPAAT
ncbi:MAG: transcription antitermination factor NusB [Akkermansiaceae bacterium]|nr:transcription antitermination factor NusB [Akkermansiaceae bacterium]